MSRRFGITAFAVALSVFSLPTLTTQALHAAEVDSKIARPPYRPPHSPVRPPHRPPPVRPVPPRLTPVPRPPAPAPIIPRRPLPRPPAYPPRPVPPRPVPPAPGYPQPVPVQDIYVNYELFNQRYDLTPAVDYWNGYRVVAVEVEALRADVTSRLIVEVNGQYFTEAQGAPRIYIPISQYMDVRYQNALSLFVENRMWIQRIRLHLTRVN